MTIFAKMAAFALNNIFNFLFDLMTVVEIGYPHKKFLQTETSHRHHWPTSNKQKAGITKAKIMK